MPNSSQDVPHVATCTQPKLTLLFGADFLAPSFSTTSNAPNVERNITASPGNPISCRSSSIPLSASSSPSYCSWPCLGFKRCDCERTRLTEPQAAPLNNLLSATPTQQNQAIHPKEAGRFIGKAASMNQVSKLFIGVVLFCGILAIISG